jgi:antitoxin ParD1/3/4
MTATMSTVSTITLPAQLKQWAETQANVGGFENVDEYVGQVLREERKRQSLESLELKLLDALNSGPATPMTDGDWNELKQLARCGC